MAVYLGQTFVNESAPGVRSHLWILVSDPSKDTRCVLVNVSSKPCPSNESCVVKAGEHQFCTADSFVRFTEVRIADRAQLEQLLSKGLLKQSKDADHDAPILQRIQHAVALSQAVKTEAVEILKAQGYSPS